MKTGSQAHSSGPWNMRCNDCGDSPTERIIYFPDKAYCKKCSSKNLTFTIHVDRSSTPRPQISDKQTF